jgi:hypothetical protein
MARHLARNGVGSKARYAFWGAERFYHVPAIRGLVAQALAGPALKGGELANVSPSADLAALAKLTANWRSVIEDATVTAQEREDAKSGQLGMKL